MSCSTNFAGVEPTSRAKIGEKLRSQVNPLCASDSRPHSETLTSSKLNCLSSLSYGLPSTSTYG